MTRLDTTMALKNITFALNLLFFTQIALANDNYHQCLFDKKNEQLAADHDQTLAIYCTSRHFDTAPTAFQAQVLNQDLAGMLERDPKFNAFYQGIRKHSSNNIYTDRQIILMYIDKREVNKD